MALPFVLLPLLVLTGQRAWMTVREEPDVPSTRTRPVAEQAQGKLADETDEAEQAHTGSDIKAVQTPGESDSLQLMPFTLGGSSVAPTPAAAPQEAPRAVAEADEEDGVKIGRFGNHWTVVVLVWLIYALIVLCDGFVIITSAMGKS